MKNILIKIFLMFFFIPNNILSAHCIVFIHMGPSIPQYFFDALAQARLFNTCPIYLIADEKAINNSKCHTINDNNFHLIHTKSLAKTETHTNFIQNSGLHRHNNPFWIYASERFFYLNEFMTKYNMEDVFHLENDIMLYADLNELLPVFKKNYPGIGAVFDNDLRCIPSLMFIAHYRCLSELTNYIASNAPKGLNDMEIIALFKNSHSTDTINNLPIIMDSYITKYGLKSIHNHSTTNPKFYSNNYDLFNSIFDGAALGQYLFGTVLTHLGPGFINETCLFNPSELHYEWHRDSQNRNIPYAKIDDKLYRINNLHMHSKKLHLASSSL